MRKCCRKAQRRNIFPLRDNAFKLYLIATMMPGGDCGGRGRHWRITGRYQSPASDFALLGAWVGMHIPITSLVSRNTRPGLSPSKAMSFDVITHARPAVQPACSVHLCRAAAVPRSPDPHGAIPYFVCPLT
jgi:hypothetical protein